MSTLKAKSQQSMGLDVASIQKDFPILRRKINGKPLIYLDNAATSQKPSVVIEAIANYYRNSNANIHRGIHTLSQEATAAYENVRKHTAEFIAADSERSIIFTRNATEAINLVAYAYARQKLKKGDEILLSEMEHHSNLVPWFLIAKEKELVIKHIPVTEQGELDMSQFKQLLSKRTKLVSVVHKSNVLGTVNPISQICAAAHEKGAVVVVDGAQSTPHLAIDVKQLDCDFFAFSGHKMLGPTGVGVLYAKFDLLDHMQPFLGGGEMIREVHLDHATWNDTPWKFEAGTPNIADVIAFGESLNYLQEIGLDNIYAHEMDLSDDLLKKLKAFPSIKVFGPQDASKRAGVVSFYDKDVHPHDLSTVLDSLGIAIRAGHHCAQPLMRRFGVPATARASFYLYNDASHVDALIDGLAYARKYFKL